MSSARNKKGNSGRHLPKEASASLARETWRVVRSGRYKGWIREMCWATCILRRGRQRSGKRWQWRASRINLQKMRHQDRERSNQPIHFLWRRLAKSHGMMSKREIWGSQAIVPTLNSWLVLCRAETPLSSEFVGHNGRPSPSSWRNWKKSKTKTTKSRLKKLLTKSCSLVKHNSKTCTPIRSKSCERGFRRSRKISYLKSLKWRISSHPETVWGSVTLELAKHRINSLMSPWTGNR